MKADSSLCCARAGGIIAGAAVLGSGTVGVGVGAEAVAGGVAGLELKG